MATMGGLCLPAPPYGQAKDPINQTGMVAHNVVTGELGLTGPNELAEDMPVLDVSTVGEDAAGHMPTRSTFPAPGCGRGSEIRPRPCWSRGRAKPADSGHENDPVSQCEAVEFLVTTESNDRQIRVHLPLTGLMRWRNQPEKGGSSKHHGAD